MRGRSVGGANAVGGRFIAFVLLLGPALASPCSAQQPPPGAVYGYTDDHGRLSYVRNLADIPLRLRQHARRVGDAGEPSLVDLIGTQTSGRPVLYRYVEPDGRTAFTNLPDTIPQAQRASAKLDLSQVSLNSELGRDLERRLDAEHERWVQQPECQQRMAAASKPFVAVLWDQHGPLLVCGGAIALLVFATRYMLRRVGGREWARTLSMAISVLAVAGSLAYGVIRSNRAMSELKAAAAPCESGTWDALASQDQGLVKKLQLLQGMRIQQQGLEEIAREGR